MATEVYFISNDGTKAAYAHLESATPAEAADVLRQAWGKEIRVLPGRTTWRAQARKTGPPDTDVMRAVP